MSSETHSPKCPYFSPESELNSVSLQCTCLASALPVPALDLEAERLINAYGTEVLAYNRPGVKFVFGALQDARKALFDFIGALRSRLSEADRDLEQRTLERNEQTERAEKAEARISEAPANPSTSIDTRLASCDSSWLVSRCQDALREAGQTGTVRGARYLRDAVEIILSQAQASIASFKPQAGGDKPNVTDGGRA